MTLLRRGFKTWCENAAGGYRRDLGLARHDGLDPQTLARHLGIEIWTPETIPGLDPAVVRHLLKVDSGSWSALTLTVGRDTIIISNTSHARARANSNLAHELAHQILKHEPAQVFLTADGKMMINHYNPVHEEEASCLSATLLVPREALLHLLALGYTDSQMMEHFGVSAALLTMRKNVTGVVRQLDRRVARTL